METILDILKTSYHNVYLIYIIAKSVPNLAE